MGMGKTLPVCSINVPSTKGYRGDPKKIDVSELEVRGCAAVRKLAVGRWGDSEKLSSSGCGGSW